MLITLFSLSESILLQLCYKPITEMIPRRKKPHKAKFVRFELLSFYEKGQNGQKLIIQ